MLTLHVELERKNKFGGKMFFEVWEFGEERWKSEEWDRRIESGVRLSKMVPEAHNKNIVIGAPTKQTNVE